MKPHLTKGLTFLCSALLTFLVAKLALSQKSVAASTQGDALSGAGNGGVEQAALQPFLAVETQSEGTGRAVVGTDHDGSVYADFVMDPFEVKKSNERHGWTLTNARSIKHVDLLSHNDDERARHLDENFWVSHRELVYRNETFADILARARENNEELKEVIVPGIGGVEYQIEVTDSHHFINEEGIPEGGIVGHLAGDPDSEVTFGYYGQRESGGITSTNENVFISYDPREDGQIIVKQIDDDALNYHFSETDCHTIHDANQVGEPNPEL